MLARIEGGRRPRRWAGQAEPRAGAAPLWGCAARLVQLNPPVKGTQNVIPSPGAEPPAVGPGRGQHSP